MKNISIRQDSWTRNVRTWIKHQRSPVNSTSRSCDWSEEFWVRFLNNKILPRLDKYSLPASKHSWLIGYFPSLGVMKERTLLISIWSCPRTDVTSRRRIYLCISIIMRMMLLKRLSEMIWRHWTLIVFWVNTRISYLLLHYCKTYYPDYYSQFFSLSR